MRWAPRIADSSCERCFVQLARDGGVVDERAGVAGGAARRARSRRPHPRAVDVGRDQRERRAGRRRSERPRASTTSAPAVPVAGQKTPARAPPMSRSVAKVGVRPARAGRRRGSARVSRSPGPRHRGEVGGGHVRLKRGRPQRRRRSRPAPARRHPRRRTAARTASSRAPRGARASRARSAAPTVPSTRIAAGIAGSTARIASVPSTASS